MHKRAVALALMLFTITAMADSLDKIPKKITLTTTNWCPYACEGAQAESGIVHEYIKAIFANMGIDVQIKFYPWTRAIKDVETGRADGLLTAVHEEAPSLLFTASPIMAYKVCFFSDTQNQWSFSGGQSLAEITLGAIKGYGYGAVIDEYIRSADSQHRVHLISGGREIIRFINMLELKRIDAFLDDQYVIAWKTKASHKDFSQLRNAGCLEENPFYMAFNPDVPGVQALISRLNEEFAQTDNQQMLEKILNKYLSTK